MNKKSSIIIILSIVVILFTFSRIINTAEEVDKGVNFLISKRCQQDVEEYFFNIDKVSLNYIILNNTDGGFHTNATKVGILKSDYFDLAELQSFMNGALYQCGLDSSVKVSLKTSNVEKILEHYQKIQSSKGVQTNLLVEVDNTNIVIYLNNNEIQSKAR